ncbi:FecCD family ABC transporter permease [Methanomethylophilus alvi]|uniref:FecCD family ABC transporter permease n=1 Tax=Methanomethylophilus alvi TaxID=1291540 RepID=UPI0037DD86C6
MSLLILAVFLDLSWAHKLLSFSDVWNVIIGKGTWANNLIVEDNAKRVCIGSVVGAGLAVSGSVMQAMFRNPMASPYLLGLSSGASLGAAISILFAIPFIPLAISTPLLAFVFCLGTMFLVFGMSHVGGNTQTETLLLTGIAISSMMSAVVSFLTFIAGDKLESIVFWSMGGLYRASWDNIMVAVPLIILGIVVMFSYSKDLNAMMLGDNHALDLGIDVGKTRLILLIASSLVTAAAVAFVGVIGFVGLIIPHIFRIVLGPDNRILIPVSAFGGAVFLVLCDFISHVVAPSYGVLPIGVLTAIIGAPYFIYLLRRRRNEVGWS